MKFLPLFFVIILLALVNSLPNGNYLCSCDNCEYDGVILSCRCPDKNGFYYFSYIVTENITDQCVMNQYIYNCNGVLKNWNEACHTIGIYSKKDIVSLNITIFSLICGFIAFIICLVFCSFCKKKTYQPINDTNDINN